MILLDTHIWIWWVHGDERLDARLANRLGQIAAIINQVIDAIGQLRVFRAPPVTIFTRLVSEE